MAAAAAVTARADNSPSPVQWCVTSPDGSQRTVGFGDLATLFGPGGNVSLGILAAAADGGGDLWVSRGSSGTVYFTIPPSTPAALGAVLPNGDTIVSIDHYVIANGVCPGQQPSTTPPPIGSYPSTTTTATTTSVTTTAPTPSPVADPTYICESQGITPSVETRAFAYRLWDKGNFVPYAVKGSYGSTKIGNGYSLICDPYHFGLHFTQKMWVNDRGVKVGYLDLGHYPVVVGRQI